MDSKKTKCHGNCPTKWCLRVDHATKTVLIKLVDFDDPHCQVYKPISLSFKSAIASPDLLRNVLELLKSYPSVTESCLHTDILPQDLKKHVEEILDKFVALNKQQSANSQGRLIPIQGFSRCIIFNNTLIPIPSQTETKESTQTKTETTTVGHDNNTNVAAGGASAVNTTVGDASGENVTADNTATTSAGKISTGNVVAGDAVVVNETSRETSTTNMAAGNVGAQNVTPGVFVKRFNFDFY